MRVFRQRPIFGKIRFMNYKGCTRKFDIPAYVRQIGDLGGGGASGGGGGSNQKDLKSMLKSGAGGKKKKKKAGVMPTLVTAPPKKKAKVKPQVADIF